jgi:chaperone BCS1
MSGASLIELLASAIRGGIEPERLFELYIPGFKSMRNIFKTWFRIDLSKVMTFGFFCLLYTTTGRTMAYQLYEQLLGYLTSTMSIPAEDRVNREVLTWMSHHIAKQNVRFLAVQSTASGVTSPYGSSYVSKSDKRSLREALNAAGGLDAEKKPMHYYPAMGKIYFMFQGRPFIFDLLPGRYVYSEEFNPVPKGTEPILIRCFGRSSAPLKGFLEHCREYSLKSRDSLTTIYTTQFERYGSRLEWREANLRPIRPLDTVDLETSVKHDILKDMERYLHPSTRLFYARRGIPYRRGYLFYGPPGTGKTSFSLALAGHFELDLYMLSLSSKNLNDDMLNALFNLLPPKCIILLEDIDSAGIDREIQNVGKPEEEGGERKENEDKKKKKHSVTLSGLLNTIDGAASQEGRVLVMTSNTPETLDPALIRHGRIDKQIKFDYISRFDAKQLFIRMFSTHQDERVEEVGAGSESDENSAAEGEEAVLTSDEEDVKSLAEAFGGKIPERQLSPAEIQGFLLDHRDDARAAVAKVSNWALDTLAARRDDGEKVKQNGSMSAVEMGSSLARSHSR